MLGHFSSDPDQAWRSIINEFATGSAYLCVARSGCIVGASLVCLCDAGGLGEADLWQTISNCIRQRPSRWSPRGQNPGSRSHPPGFGAASMCRTKVSAMSKFSCRVRTDFLAGEQFSGSQLQGAQAKLQSCETCSQFVGRLGHPWGDFGTVGALSAVSSQTRRLRCAGRGGQPVELELPCVGKT